MALWGNKDTKALTGTVAATQGGGAIVGTSTLFTTELKSGQTILITGAQYRVTAIADNTHATVEPIYAGVTGSGKSIAANEQPAFIPVAQFGEIYGVSDAEVSSGGDNILGFAVTESGTLYVEVPNVTLSGGGGSGASADATIEDGAVTAVTIDEVGSSYESVPTVEIPKARISVPLADVDADLDTVAYEGHGLELAESVKYKNGGGTSITGLVSNSNYFVSTIGLGDDEFKLATTAQLAAGTTLGTVVINDLVPGVALTTLEITGIAGEFTCDAATLRVGSRVKITGTAGGTGSIVGYSTGNVYKVSAVTGTSPNVTGFTLTTEGDVAIVTTIGTPTGLTYTAGVDGAFTCAAATLAVGSRVQITGTLGGTGTITGYATGNVYKVAAVTGTSPNVTGFRLTTEAGVAIVTSAGTPTGLTYKAGTVIDLTGTGNDDQYFEKNASVAATAIALKGVGGANSAVQHSGWVKKTSGTGGRAGRVTFETLVAMSSISGDASDNAAFPGS